MKSYCILFRASEKFFLKSVNTSRYDVFCHPISHGTLPTFSLSLRKQKAGQIAQCSVRILLPNSTWLSSSLFRIAWWCGGDVRFRDRLTRFLLYAYRCGEISSIRCFLTVLKVCIVLIGRGIKSLSTFHYVGIRNACKKGVPLVCISL